MTMTAPPPDFDAALTAGRARLSERDFRSAIGALREATRLQPNAAAAWRALGNALHGAGERAAANDAHLRALALSAGAPKQLEAERAFAEGRPQFAYSLLAPRLAAEPTDLAALHLMARIATATGRHSEAMKMLDAALEMAPGFEAAWRSLAELLHRLPPATALDAVAKRLARRPDVPGFQSLHAAMLERSGDYAGALAAWEAILATTPARAGAWVALGHVRKTLGDADGAATAYRRALAIDPAAGDAWWALADMKAFRFTADDTAAIEALVARGDLADAVRADALFALGRAREQDDNAPAAFAAYREANGLKATTLPPYDAAAAAAALAADRALFTPDFFAARDGQGAPDADPIFIVGLPRSGSTLVEQILASHPAIEATRELGDLPDLARDLALAGAARRRPYPALLADLPAAELRRIGEAYLARTRCQRRAGTPFFIDKLPANFRHVGLIRTVLPHARVIDVRRDLPGCGFSIFKQNFASGHGYAWRLEDIAAHYRHYEATMALWDAVLPGFVQRVDYAALVDDTEREVRALLDWLGLPFDPACLRFWETRRPVRTPSGDQVRQPIFRDGLDHWRRYADALDCFLDR
ncbi:tetratricopeptide repeat-containing sulfotransferase family protein [Sphingomonas sp. RS6]